MQIQDLARAYSTKTGEELQQLAENAEQLTPEAGIALKGELAKRRIDGFTHLSVQEEVGSEVGQPKIHEPPLLHKSQPVANFIEEVFRVYRVHFWLFVKLVAPAVVLGYIAIVQGRSEGQEIARHLPRGIALREHLTEIFELWLVNLVGFFVSWIAFSFSFGAICSAVGRITAGAVPSPSECFGDVRARMGPFLRVSTLLLLLTGAALAVTAVLDLAVLTILRYCHVHLSIFLMKLVPSLCFGLTLLVLTSFGLAMPAIILDDLKVGKAMFHSHELTEGKWITLAVLLAKSLIGGYIAGMFPFWLAGWIWTYIRMPSWFLNAASIAAVTTIEPFMFIGFALLYVQMTRLSSTSNHGLGYGGGTFPLANW